MQLTYSNLWHESFLLTACPICMLQQGGQPVGPQLGGGLHHETSLSRHQQLLVQQQQQQHALQGGQMDGRQGLGSDPYGSGAYSSGLAGSGGSSQLFPGDNSDFVVCIGLPCSAPHNAKAPAELKTLMTTEMRRLY